MYRKFFDLILVGLVAFVAVVLALASVDNWAVQFLFGIPLVLFIPGYVLVEALSGPEMERTRRLLFSFGLSLLVTIAGGLLLNILPWGLLPGSWAIWLGGITLVAAGIAALKRGPGARLPQASGTLSRSNLKWSQLGLMGAAAIVVIAAVLVARSSAATAATDESFTQLWAIPDQTNLKVGLLNQERTAKKYKVQVVAGTTVIQEWPSLEVANGQEWETTFSLANVAAGSEPVEVKLYQLDKPDTIYRQVFISRGQATAQS